MVGAVDKHLALIGFMGAGKSTLGRELARLTHRPFVDTDEEIEKRFGPIGELFERGEPEFRRIEEQVVAEALAGPTSVIALGGGAVLSEADPESVSRGPRSWRGCRSTSTPPGRASVNPAVHWLGTESSSGGSTTSVRDSTTESPKAKAKTSSRSSWRRFGIGPSIRLPDNAALIVDERVAPLHELELAPVTTHVVPSGEDGEDAGGRRSSVERARDRP